MKRFGLPILLSAGYASLLLLVFSSDFSKEHSFLLRESPAFPKAKAVERSVENRAYGLVGRIASLQVDPREAKLSAKTNELEGLQSPESSESGQ